MSTLCKSPLLLYIISLILPNLLFSQHSNKPSKNYLEHEKLVFIEFRYAMESNIKSIHFIFGNNKWSRIKQIIEKEGNIKFDTATCFTCNEKIDNALLEEIADLSKPYNHPKKGCVLMYNFELKDGQLYMKTKDFWSEQMVKVGYISNGFRASVEQEDPFLAGELCPEQLERWRMLRLVKILMSIE
jgi:hypothetical protein